MPEMTFTVQWPDGRIQSCYSPSLVMHDHLAIGQEYSVADFLTRARTALTEASERVKAKFGMYCTSAAEQLHEIEKAAALHSPTSAVRVVAMVPATVSGGAR
ncbi:MSMEG_0570 family nitrogen starvation response protein [Rhodococcus koreensis]